MLLGIPENYIEVIEQEVIVRSLIHTNGIVSCSLEWLLTSFDPDRPVYSAGADRLRSVLGEEPTDYLSNTPLEAAFQWCLSCYSSVYKKLDFLSVNFSIECKELLPGRFFPSTESDNYDVEGLQPDIIYYAKEKTGENTHTLADMLFCTKDGELVLVDVTGGG